MKKVTFLMAAVALLAACTQENLGPQQTTGGIAVQFDAYSSTNVETRGKIQSVSDFQDKGIGVFAFYQPKGYFNTFKYATPDFMYNQQVTTLDGGATWSYAPVKYWPNNTGDMLSFFAYAPYSADKTWEDMGFKTDVNGRKLTTTFAIYQDAGDQLDYIYAAPVLNKTKQAVDANGNVYASGTSNIKFDFKHITSQLNLFVGVEQNTASQQPTAWTDPNTSIEVQSIEFKDLTTAMTYSYAINDGVPDTAVITLSQTRQDIRLEGDDFVATAATVNTANYGTAQFKQLNVNTGDRQSILFLAPEKLGKVVVTYKVTTIDANDVKNANSSVVTNVIESDLSNLTLEAGKSYKLNFLIGMNSVKIVATLTDWATPAIEKHIDVPANFSDSVPSTGDYFYFEALEANSKVAMIASNSTSTVPSVSLVYSTDDRNTWNDYTVGTTGDITLANVGDKVYFKAKDGVTNDRISSNPANKHFVNTGSVKVCGNIMYLLNGTTPPQDLVPGTNDYCFYVLFGRSINDYYLLGYTGCIDASELLLPASTLAPYCYQAMFTNEVNYYNPSFVFLTGAPVLPAKTLVEGCYYMMFNNSASLSSVTMLATDVSATDCLLIWLNGAGSGATNPTLYVDPSMTSNSTIEAQKGSFTIAPYVAP